MTNDNSNNEHFPTRCLAAAKIYENAVHELTFPMWGSPKLDGIRALIHPTRGAVAARSFKPIANEFLRNELAKLPQGWDGELVAGKADFNDIQSLVMSYGGEPSIEFMVFDNADYPSWDFAERIRTVADMLSEVPMEDICYPETLSPKIQVTLVEQILIHNAEQLIAQYKDYLAQGYEGIILRGIDSKYKSGKSTIKQQHLVKLKPESDEDAEGRIIGYYELMVNNNPQVADNFGLAKRSSQKAGKIPGNTLGGFILMTKWGELRVGSGFTKAQRQNFWDHKIHVGQYVKFVYQKEGMKHLPRFPIFKGFRDEADMDPETIAEIDRKWKGEDDGDELKDV